MEATANANGSKYIYKTHTKNTQTHKHTLYTSVPKGKELPTTPTELNRK